MQEQHYYHQPKRPPGAMAKMAARLAMAAGAAMFAGVCALTINAIGESEDETAASTRIKFYDYRNGAGAGGYDVVAYFSESAAAKGSAEHFAEWGGEKWLFATAENREAFLQNPSRYIPQYGGHCAYGVASGYLVRGDPTAWTVKDGKLYLNYNANIRIAWLADSDGFLAKSEPNWKELNR